MNINMTAPEGVAEVDVLAERYRGAFNKIKGGRAQWIEGTLELATIVSDARIDYPDHRAFSRWLEHQNLPKISKDNRTSLLWMAEDIEAARNELEQARSWSWELIYRKSPRRVKNGTLRSLPKGTTSTRGHLSGANQRKRKREPVIPTVMRDDYEPGSVPRLAEPLSPKQRRQRRVAQDASPPPPPRKGVLLKGLTKEQVDPDFQGTHLEFITKYGHVNLQTKQQIEHHKSQEELMAWLGLVSDHERTARALLTAVAVDPATLRAWMSKPAKAAKMQAWRDSIERACEILRSFGNCEREDDPALPLITEYVQ